MWEDIPSLAVLTGPNGSGKSQLLVAIQTGVPNAVRTNELREQIERTGVTLDIAKGNVKNLAFKLNSEFSSSTERRLIESKRHVNDYQSSMLRLREEVDGAVYAEVVLLSAEAGPAQILDPNAVALVADAYQSTTSQALAPSQVSSLLDKVSPRGYRSQTLSASFEPVTTQKLSESPGLAVDVASPLDGLSLAMQAYRAEDFHRYETSKRRDVPPAAPLPPPPWDVVNLLLEEGRFPLRVAAPNSRVDEAVPVRFVSKGHTVGIEGLSSGERTIVGLVSSLYAGRNGAQLPKLLLLDEPDAHLHPSLTAQVLNAIDDVLVRRLGVRVLLTTHSPSTVALAPDDSVFVMEDGRVRACDKWAAVSILTAGIVTVGPDTKFVFVEDIDDVKFYSTVVDVLERLDPSFPKGRLVFLPANKDMADDQAGSGGWTRVVKWVGDLATPVVAGLIDQDNGPADGTSDPPRVWRVGRHALENYLLDPLLLAAFKARSQGKVLESFAPFEGNESNLHQADAMALQRVVDEVVKAIGDELTPAPEDDFRDVSYVSGPTLRLPAWLLEHRGKDLNAPLQAGLRFPLVVDRLVEMVRLTQLVPQELADTLREIAEG